MRQLGLGKVVGYLASAVLIFLGVIFLMASAYAISRLLVGAILTIVGLGIGFLAWRGGQRQVTIKQEIETPGSLKIGSLKCPNCGAGLDLSKMELRLGGPSVKCPYCGNEFDVTEEPRW
jgi:predicted Zn finger-like uncharacterized protein